MPVPPPHNPEAGKGFDKGGIRAGPFRRRGFTSDSEENIYQMGELLPSEGQDGGGAEDRTSALTLPMGGSF